MPKGVTRKIPGETWYQLICDDYSEDDWVKREERFTSTWRWGNWYEVIVEHVPTMTFWSGSYCTGGDSQGLGDVNNFNVPEELTQVSREAVTVWEWKPVYEKPD